MQTIQIQIKAPAVEGQRTFDGSHEGSQSPEHISSTPEHNATPEIGGSSTVTQQVS